MKNYRDLSKPVGLSCKGLHMVFFAKSFFLQDRSLSLLKCGVDLDIVLVRDTISYRLLLHTLTDYPEHFVEPLLYWKI